MVCLDELVAEDCRYRKLDRLIDWSFVREAAGLYYADDVGRPSIDPIVLVKLMVAAALEGIGSARELCRVAGLRLDLRRFLGYGFHERLPVHQTLSHAQTRRFVDGALFERLFLRSLALRSAQYVRAERSSRPVSVGKRSSAVHRRVCSRPYAWTEHDDRRLSTVVKSSERVPHLSLPSGHHTTAAVPARFVRSGEYGLRPLEKSTPAISSVGNTRPSVLVRSKHVLMVECPNPCISSAGGARLRRGAADAAARA